MEDSVSSLVRHADTCVCEIFSFTILYEMLSERRWR